MTRRAAAARSGIATLVASLAVPASASAHGIQGRADLPVPLVAFYWAAGVVLVVSFVFSIVMQRTEHFYFAVGTLGLQTIIVLVVTKWQGFTHGPGGETIGIRPLEFFGQTFQTDFAAFKVLVAVLGLGLIAAAMIERSPVRREAIAVRDQPVVAGTLGLPTLRKDLRNS